MSFLCIKQGDYTGLSKDSSGYAQEWVVWARITVQCDELVQDLVISICVMNPCPPGWAWEGRVNHLSPRVSTEGRVFVYTAGKPSHMEMLWLQWKPALHMKAHPWFTHNTITLSSWGILHIWLMLPMRIDWRCEWQRPGPTDFPLLEKSCSPAAVNHLPLISWHNWCSSIVTTDSFTFVSWLPGQLRA